MSRRPQPSALSLVDNLFGEDLHAKRIESLAAATGGLLQAASIGVAAIGRALATANGLDPRHAIKQVDRLFSNGAIDPLRLAARWVPFVVAERKEIVVALDWTDFDADDQSTISLHLVTTHGRTTPLLWKTWKKSKLGGCRNDAEDELLVRLREVLPADVRVIVLADRGFGDTKLFAFLERLGFDYIIRFRQIIKVTSAEGEARPAAEWVPANGRPLLLRNARVTVDAVPVGAVVCVRAKGMKEAWCLATSSTTALGSDVVSLYAKRFTIEEAFRDLKDPRFGKGLSQMRVSSPSRRDRILLVAALATALLTLLGAAGESVGLDRRLKANTSKKRTHSLFFQGTYYFTAIPNMREEQLVPLLQAFDRLLRSHAVFTEAFGLL